ncbi:hypothetical protein TCAL_03833 [Tigriopus californicus]|uniref:Ig-like domain-containing protein n=1 Tax=Tigriopus californicus TaxID=6832 RepID=A0A553PGR1_TIGCA|nr:hypothetical protein TCAL_03833 [Tigriopus californicus]
MTRVQDASPWVFGLVLCSTLVPNSAGRQNFDLEPQMQEVNPGETTTMICRIAEKNTGSECIWQKDGKPVRLQEGKYEWNGRVNDGDCTLRIIKADIKFDDGDWRCQVTASSYTANDALSSTVGRLIVRIPPSEPRLFYNEAALGLDNDLEIKSDTTGSVRCESRGGNPAPILKWYLDEEELNGASQRNESDLANLRRWNAVSIVEITLKQEHNGKYLKCVALHDAYSRRSRDTSVRLNVLYPPRVRLEKSRDLFELEADQDRVQIRCVADANPKPDVVWRKAGGESIFRVGADLVFDPIRQGDGGTYFCLAQNDLGSSDELSITFDVLFEPRNLRTVPQRIVDLEVDSSTKFECMADGNPKPQFEWLQKVSSNGNEQVYARAKSAIIDFRNVSYEQQGEWACAATNLIKDKERRVQSNSIQVSVTGPPQVLQIQSASEQSFRKESDAEIMVPFCSDPKPRNLHWIWSTLRVDEGESQGRFSASTIKNGDKEDCYVASLIISKSLPGDSRKFVMVIREPLALIAVIGIAVVTVLMGIVVIITIVCCIKRCPFGHCCAKRKSSANFAIPHRPRVEQHYYPPEAAGSHYSIAQRPSSNTASYDTPDNYDQYPRSIPRVQPDLVPTTRRDPDYPLPPQSQFPLRGQSTYASARKTPQNTDTHVIMYADLQFPRTSNSGSTRTRPSPNEVMNNSTTNLNHIDDEDLAQMSHYHYNRVRSSALTETGSFYPQSKADI